MTRPIDPEIRFFRHVVAGLNGCWIWIGGTTPEGYARFQVGTVAEGTRGKVSGHRWLWERVNGPIPAGMHLDHVKARGCTSPRCVNPDHLEPVTPRENSLRHTRLTTHCPQGHPYDEANTYRRNGKRACRACARDRARRKREAA